MIDVLALLTTSIQNPSTEQNCCIINTLQRSTTTTACMHEEEESEPLQHEKKTSLMTLQVKK